VFLDRLCGFCCFSMRFVVFIDLFSTIIQPITVGYLVYLLYTVLKEHQTIPITSIIMLAAIYGLQALVFLFRRKWDMIGWMVFYILAIPAFSFFLPLYSFWKMDDFSWGATRVVLGEKGKKVVVHDEGKFDPKSIPLKSWSDYENELWDKESNHSIGSWVPPAKGKMDGYAESRTASLYGRETYYEPPQPQSRRSFSPVPSQMGGYPPPGYHSGRNTPVGAQGRSPLRPMSEFGAGVMPAPAPSRPGTNYFDMPVTTGSLDLGQFGQGSPSDDDIERAVTNILQGADLNTITKKNVRQRLEEHFGSDLSSRKATINAAIDRVILAHS